MCIACCSVVFCSAAKFESRFGKVDKELGEIKKRMDDLLKAQEKMASGPVRGKEDVTAETLGQYGYTALCNRRIARFDSDSLEGRESCRRKTVEGIQPIMAETTPQKLNASLEKESAEVTLQETSQRLLSKYRLFPNGSRLIMKSLSVKIFSVRLVFLYSSSESASS